MTDITKQARNLLARMTIAEKIAQLHSVWMEIESDGTALFRSKEQKKASGLNSPLEIMKDGIGQITRPLGTRPIEARDCVRGLNKIQKMLVEQTRLGIPALPHEECLAGLMVRGGTLFPAGISNGATWDESLIREIAKAIGDEMISTGSRQGLAPVLDISRDVRWGRTEETMGEDPYLTGSLGTAYVEGLQGPDRRILATLKHFAGHSFSEGGRNHAPVRIGEREFNDTFLLPFEMAIKLANAGSLMPAYHDIDGIPLHVSSQYLTEVLRNQWGFDGIIVADYEGVNLLHTDHKVAETLEDAAIMTLKAGLDIELPEYTCFKTGLLNAVNQGRLEPAIIDAAVLRVLRVKFQLGLFDNPYTDEGLVLQDKALHYKLAVKAATKSTVLLENNGILPLKENSKIALIGPLANDRLCMFSGYSFPVHLILSGQEQSDKENAHILTLKETLSKRLGDKLLYARGCDVLTKRPKDAPVFPGDISKIDGVQQKTNISMDESQISAAVKIASEADTIVLAVGDLSGLFLTGTVGEGSDVTSLRLPGIQQKLLEALLETGKPLVVVLISGRPYHLGMGYKKAAAVIQAGLPGEGGAEALDKILFGESNPGGRLPLSIPKTAGAMPYFYNYKLKSAGTPIQPKFGAEYPFGYGKSYTQFQYNDFNITDKCVKMNGEISLSCSVKNIGTTEGDEVVQLYVRDCYASLVRPVKELKGFKRITLNPGESKKVTFKVPTDILSFTYEGTSRIVEAGDFEFMIGSSSQNIHYREIVSLEGNTKTLGQKWRMKTEVEVTSL